MSENLMRSEIRIPPDMSLFIYCVTKTNLNQNLGITNITIRSNFHQSNSFKWKQKQMKIIHHQVCAHDCFEQKKRNKTKTICKHYIILIERHNKSHLRAWQEKRGKFILLFSSNFYRFIFPCYFDYTFMNKKKWNK